jgi:RecB family exonuclease
MTDPISIRASSFGELLDCAYRFEGTHILGLRRPSSLPAHLGTSVHEGTRVFDQARADKREALTAEAVEAFVYTLHHPEGETDFRGASMSLRDAESIGALLTANYCQTWSPRFEFRMVEMQFEPLDITCTNGVTIRLTGKADRARLHVASGKMGISDVKTGARAVDSEGLAVVKGHGPQAGVYELLFEASTGVACDAPANIIAMQTNKSGRIAVGEIPNAKAMMIGTEQEPGMLDFAADTLKSGLFRPNSRSTLCSQKFCARWETCRYKEG